MQQGILMADVAAALEIPYYIFSTAADVQRINYIIEKYPNMKSIFVRIVFYMQNWTTYAKVSKSDDGVIIFELPIDLKTEFDMVDVNDTGRIVREILDNSEKFVGQIIDVCGDVMRFEDVAKIFTKVTGIPAISKTLGEEEFRARLNWLPKNAQTDLIDMYTWFELYGSYSKENQWKNEQIVTKLNTFEDWLRTTGWKGE
uniref:NmrA-like family domain-containing protein 1 n=1 Tax=Adineta vaga TaxID=104782 RepID=B3G476_ADIVA|nr:NmrA-like protein [Adineta vaga]